MEKRMSDAQNLLITLKLWQNKHNTSEMNYAAASKWAVDNNYYPKPPISREERCETEMRRAVRRAKHTDPQGRMNIKTYGSLPLFDEEGNKRGLYTLHTLTSTFFCYKIFIDKKLSYL